MENIYSWKTTAAIWHETADCSLNYLPILVFAEKAASKTIYVYYQSLSLAKEKLGLDL